MKIAREKSGHVILNLTRFEYEVFCAVLCDRAGIENRRHVIPKNNKGNFVKVLHNMLTEIKMDDTSQPIIVDKKDFTFELSARGKQAMKNHSKK